MAVEKDVAMVGSLDCERAGAVNRGRLRAAVEVRGRATAEEQRLRIGALLREESIVQTKFDGGR